jgi:hypothetical protein
MGTVFTAILAAAIVGLLVLAGYIILRRVAERKVFMEEDRRQLAEAALSAKRAESDPEQIDDRPDAIVFQFPVRSREPSLDSLGTNGSSSSLAEIDEWRDRPPRPFQPRFRKP